MVWLEREPRAIHSEILSACAFDDVGGDVLRSVLHDGYTTRRTAEMSSLYL
jgi:hypothetical protein